jgi:hypothetical protein
LAATSSTSVFGALTASVPGDDVVTSPLDLNVPEGQMRPSRDREGARHGRSIRRRIVRRRQFCCLS